MIPDCRAAICADPLYCLIRMTKPQINPVPPTRPAVFAGLVAAATSIGLFAVGWITMKKLRPFKFSGQ
jgi:hypothetical protein